MAPQRNGKPDALTTIPANPAPQPFLQVCLGFTHSAKTLPHVAPSQSSNQLTPLAPLHPPDSFCERDPGLYSANVESRHSLVQKRENELVWTTREKEFKAQEAYVQFQAS